MSVDIAKYIFVLEYSIFYDNYYIPKEAQSNTHIISIYYEGLLS